MNNPRPAVNKAIPIVAALLMALVAACNREPNQNAKNTEPLQNDLPLPPIASNQTETPLAPLEPSTNMNAVENPLASPPAQGLVTTNTTVPALPPMRTNRVQEAGRVYEVVQGDTLFKISRATGVRVSALSNANPNVNLSKLRIGQKLHIPPAAAIGYKEPGSSAAGASRAQGNIHVVKAGDTLTQIAKQNHTTIQAIQDANGLKTTRILVGQKLRLPNSTQSSNTTALPKPIERETESTAPAQP